MRKGGYVEIHDESIEILKNLQSYNGSFPVYPHFSVFNYSNLSEGALCAYALDIWGEKNAARDFYLWAAKKYITKSDTFDFNEDYQLDGYGTFLWGLGKNLSEDDKDILITFGETVYIIQKFLFKSWNEAAKQYAIDNKISIHPAVLACIYGGLLEINKFYPHQETPSILENIKAVLKYDYTLNGHFIKTPKQNLIDMKLLFLLYPFNVFSLKDPIMKATYQEIKNNFNLMEKFTGEHQSEWFILSALLALCALQEFDYKFAEQIFNWMQEQANRGGYLQDLVIKQLIYPSVFYETVDRWGQSEKPFLIHHAFYLILEKELNKFIKS